MPYFPIVFQATDQPATDADKAALLEQHGGTFPPGIDPDFLTTTNFEAVAGRICPKYKQAFRAITPMLDDLVPHHLNRGFVLNRHPDKMPMMDIILRPESVPLSARKCALRQFGVPQAVVAQLRTAEEAVARGEEPSVRPENINERAWEHALSRGKTRRASSAGTLLLPKPVEDLSRDVARTVASLLSIAGRGSMTAPQLRRAIGSQVSTVGLIVQVRPGVAPAATLR